MGTNSLQTAAPRRRSFSLPSFRRSSAAERQGVLKNADEMARSSLEEAARIQKAAAWQWYTRAVGEDVTLAPTKPPVGNSQAPDKSCTGASRRRSKANVCYSNMPQTQIVEPPLAESHRAASRFKAEAGLSFTRPAASGGAPPAVPTPPAPSGGPSTPLYDELELFRLRTHMADFVHRLQHHHTLDNEQSSPAVGDHGRSRPPPPSVSIDHHQTKAPPAVPVVSSGDHQLTTLPSSPAPLASTIPFRMRPFSALQKLFRKVLSGSVPKCTNNTSQMIISAPAVSEPAEVLYNDIQSTSQYHDHHHYIHHHHHHYHFSKSPSEEQASIILSRRRHSESGSSRPCTPSVVEADSDEEEDEEEAELESRIAAYLARRRRRHSDSFSTYQLWPENAGFRKDEGMKGESAKVELPMQFSSWRYSSERFLPSKIPTMVGSDIAEPVEDDQFDEGTFVGIRRRRRSSAELHREEPSLEQTGGKSQGGAYILGGAGAGCGTAPALTPMGRRRYSESSKVRP